MLPRVIAARDGDEVVGYAHWRIRIPTRTRRSPRGSSFRPSGSRAC
jgi:hypothetical protein